MSESQHSLIVSAAIVTLIVTPSLISLSSRATAWLNRQHSVAPMTDTESYETIEHRLCEFLIIGFGPAGRGAVEHLGNIRDRVLVVDLSPEGIARAEGMGFRAEIGDASNAEVLEHLHLERVRVAVITLPSRSEAIAVLNLLRRIVPQATTIVRSRHQIHMSEFLENGADIVVGDEEEVQKALASTVYQQYQRLSAAES